MEGIETAFKLFILGVLLFTAFLMFKDKERAPAESRPMLVEVYHEGQCFLIVRGGSHSGIAGVVRCKP